MMTAGAAAAGGARDCGNPTLTPALPIGFEASCSPRPGAGAACRGFQGSGKA